MADLNQIINNNNPGPKIYYTDISTQFTLDSSQFLLNNVNAVNNELLNLIMTSLGEVDFEPDFGSEMPTLLFEQPTGVTTWMIGNVLFIAVATWIPYIAIDFSGTTITPLALQAGYNFRLRYSIDGITSGQADFHFQT